MPEAPLLVATAVSKQFGGLAALTEVSLAIAHGEIFGLIGPNGAGKTTLFNVLTGIYRPDSGEFAFAGARVSGLQPHRIAEHGIARTFQNIRIFANMTALENVLVGCHVRTHAGVIGAVLRGARTRAEEAAITRRARELLDYCGIARHANELARHLAYGDQRRLEIARALATEPRLLALDEPAAGMNTTETAELGLARACPRAGGDTAADRARREARHGPVRPRRRARLRPEDRRRRSGRSSARPRGDRSLPRKRPCLKSRA